MSGHTRIEFWQSRDGRWYWHRVVNGEVTAAGSYRYRRSLRRAMRRMYPDVPLVRR